MKWVIGILAVLIGLYILLVIGVYVMQRKLLYFPPENYLSPADVNVEMEEIRNAQNDIISWWTPPTSPDGKTVMVFHGNGSAIYSHYDVFNDLIEAGHGVLSVGYPGYPGQSGVSPTQKSLTEAAKRQYEWVVNQGISPENIVFYGTSLGSAVAAQLSITHEPSLFIADASFNSIVAVGAEAMPFLPVRFLLKDKFLSDEALQNGSFPLIWIHGTKDTIVPLKFGELLFEGYKGPKTAYRIEDGLHNNLWGLGGRDIVLKALKSEIN
ncbi:alpha/beta hydrolase [Litorimonas sp.]|uniref:alpha/beta hydrolase n=1 Tax=Litorimonas sp. TaxID=1892381 RepID=UPI003A86F3B4